MPNLAETITHIELYKLVPFKDHPYAVREDEAMTQTVESVNEYGVIVPAIARPLDNGTFELISGHRRKRACELAGLTTMPVIVRELDRDAATILMVDSNLQRENILPSERAKAYKMKMEAIKRQVGTKLRADIKVASETEESARTVQRYIRLTELQPQLQQMVDEGKIGITPAVELAFLTPTEQTLLLDTIDSEQARKLEPVAPDG